MSVYGLAFGCSALEFVGFEKCGRSLFWKKIPKNAVIMEKNPHPLI
jgi:hypothetical protein